MNMNNTIYTIEELEAAKKILAYLDIDSDDDSVMTHFKHSYLTVNTARNGKDYIWYLDENKSAVCDITTGEIITDEDFISKQFC